MDPKMTPKLSRIGSILDLPKVPKPWYFLVFSHETGARRGPVFDPKMSSEMIQNWVQFLMKLSRNRPPRGPDLIKNDNLINNVPILFYSEPGGWLIEKIILIDHFYSSFFLSLGAGF